MALLHKIKLFKPVLFILPALFFYVIFLVIPILRTVQFSFFHWDGASPVMTFIGLDNYTHMLHDDIFWRSLAHNLFWIVSTIVLPVSVGLVLAVMLSSNLVKHKMIFRVTYFLPVILSLVAVGVVWNWMYHPDFGLINGFFRLFGLDSLHRLGSAMNIPYCLRLSWPEAGLTMDFAW
jgi:raffinose/stachyose/melibiose transport system permease protein